MHNQAIRNANRAAPDAPPLGLREPSREGLMQMAVVVATPRCAASDPSPILTRDLVCNRANQFVVTGSEHGSND
jgi:hypothetical protein